MQLSQTKPNALGRKPQRNSSQSICRHRPTRSLKLYAAANLQQGGPGSLGSLTEAAGGAITRLQRYMQPPPAGFPPGPPGDQSLGLLSDPLGFISRLRRDYGPVVGLLLGGERVVLVAEPAAARQVLVQQPDVFVKAGTAFFPGSSLTGNGLLVSDGEVWKRQRRLSNPAFRKAAVDRYSEAMVTEAQRLLDGPFAAAAAANSRQQQAGAAATAAGLPAGVRDVYADFNQLTLNITLSALFSISDSDSSRSGSRAAVIVAAVEKAFSYFAARGATAMVVPEWVPTPDNIAFKEAVQQLDSLVYSIIDSRRTTTTPPPTSSSSISSNGSQQQQQQENGPAPVSPGAAASDLLQALLDSVDDSGQPMSRTALRDELMTLLVAGQETSAILLGWAAALLAHNPKIQAAAAAEVASVFGDSRPQHTAASSSSSGSSGSQQQQQQYAVPSASDIPQLPLVTAVVLEALRLWSPAYMVGRCACKDVELEGGYALPAGTTCLVSPYLLHREPTRWKQPMVFKPERWMPLLQQQQQQQPAQQQQQQTQEGGCPFSSSSNSSSGDAAGADSTAAAAAAAGGCPMSSPTAAAAGGGSGGYSFASVLRELGPNGAYVPFGGGPRNCIGTGFAMTEAVLVLAMLLQRYELQPVSPAAGFPRPKPMLTLRPDRVQLRVLPREAKQQQQQQQGQAQQQQPAQQQQQPVQQQPERVAA